MNITRLTLSVTMLLSVASIVAHNEATFCPDSCDLSAAAATPETTKVGSIDEILETATQDFLLTDLEVVQLRKHLEADINADVAVIVSEIRTAQADAEAVEKTAEVAKDMI